MLGVAVGGHHAHLVADAALLELLGRRLHRGHVALGAHHDADARRVDLEALELGLDRVSVTASAGRAWLVLDAAMSRRSCVPSKAITSAAAYAAARAAARSSPSAVTFEHAAAGGDDRRRRARAVPAWVTSTPRGTASSPG